MSYICNVAIRLDDQQAVSKDTFGAFVDFLAESGYSKLDGDTLLRKSNDDGDTVDETEARSSRDVSDFVARNGVDGTSVVIKHNVGYGNEDRWTNRTSELAREVQDGAAKTAERLGEDVMLDIYMNAGFGNVVEAVCGEALGWQFYIGGDGWVENSAVLEECLTASSPHFASIRKNMERIFGCTTTVECLIIG